MNAFKKLIDSFTQLLLEMKVHQPTYRLPNSLTRPSHVALCPRSSNRRP